MIEKPFLELHQDINTFWLIFELVFCYQVVLYYKTRATRITSNIQYIYIYMFIAYIPICLRLSYQHDMMVNYDLHIYDNSLM